MNGYWYMFTIDISTRWMERLIQRTAEGQYLKPISHTHNLPMKNVKVEKYEYDSQFVHKFLFKNI